MSRATMMSPLRSSRVAMGYWLKRGPDLIHGLIEIEMDDLVLGLLHFRQETSRIGFKLFEENALAGDLRLDVAVGAAADADADGTRSAVAGHTDHADIQAEVFAAELGA